MTVEEQLQKQIELLKPQTDSFYIYAHATETRLPISESVGTILENTVYRSSTSDPITGTWPD
jgi:hypothetical protein